MTDQEKIEWLRTSLVWLMSECETNDMFGEDKGERDSLENAQNALDEVTGTKTINRWWNNLEDLP